MRSLLRESPIMRALVLCAFLLQLGGPPSAWAWNRAGHMTTGAIAYRELKASDPAALGRMLTLLREHPHYETRWARMVEGMGGEEGELYLFMLAARWADDIRSLPAFNHDAWHYINYAYRPPSTAPANPAPKENVVDELVQNRALVRTAPTAAQRAVALCWVMHLTGDIHQPLHTTQLFNDTFPRGDRGGTAFLIRTEDGEQPISLHQLWDGLVIGSDRFQAVRNTATELINRADLQKENFARELAETSPERWAKAESFPLAVRAVYLNGQLARSPTGFDAEVLPPEYLAKSKAVAERQLTLAGYRLAQTLRKLGQP